MKITFLLAIWTTLLLCFSNRSIAQEYSELSEAERLTIRLKSYVLIDPDTVSADILINLKVPIALNLTGKNIYRSSIEKYFNFNEKIIYLSDKEVEFKIPSNKETIRIAPTSMDIVKINRALDSINTRYTGTQELGGLFVKNTTILNDSLIYNLWRSSGKLPNFIFTDKSSIQAVAKIVKKINSINKVFGVVRTEKKVLNHVEFIGDKYIQVNGYFSFPVNGNPFPNLIPLKAGYYFSPDIINITKENSSNLKEFIARPLDENFKLLYHFVFDSKIKNKVDQKSEEILLNGVEIKNDKSHGSVGYFNNRAYIDAGLKSRDILKSNFTITAWIKPTELHNNNSILGKGRNFVLKLHEGNLTFTMAGIKDYISNSSPIPINEWTHIGLVHSKNTNDLIFYINGKQTDRVSLIEDYVSSDYNLLIGNNLWEEFFIGYLSDVKIWERELNEIEVFNQYQNKTNRTTRNYTTIAIGIVLIIGIFFFFFLKRSQNTKFTKKSLPLKKNQSDTQFKSMPLLKDTEYKEHILCFGTLKIKNKEHENIAKKLSPKLKKIFIIILLHSSEGQKGISTAKLTELIWPGMTVKSAKNTRGTNIQNLRSALASCSEINIIFKDKFWFLEIGKKCYCDYHTALNYLDLFSNKNNAVKELEEELPKFLELLKEGRLLMSSSDSWLDPFIVKFSNNIIKQCFESSKKLNIENHNELLYRIAEVVYIYDDLNEKALQLKLQSLIQQGKLSLARTVFDNFTKLYLKLYKEAYPNSFEAILSGDYIY